MSVEVREREKKQQGKKKKVQYLGARSRNEEGRFRYRQGDFGSGQHLF